MSQNACEELINRLHAVCQDIRLNDKECKRVEDLSKCIDEVEKCLRNSECSKYQEKIKHQLAIGYNERGFIQYKKVNFDEAIEDYTRALTHDHSLYISYYNRGLIHYRLARYNEAMADMKHAITIKEDFKPAQQCLQQAQIDCQLSSLSNTCR